MEDFIFQIMAVRVYPIIGALSEPSKNVHEIPEQRKVAEEYFEYLEKNNIMQNSDTQYYRENIYRLFEIIETTSYTDQYGRTIYNNTFRDWNSQSFYRCFITGGKYPGMIDKVHTDEFDSKHNYEYQGFRKSSTLKNYVNAKTRFIHSKKREYLIQMTLFLEEKKNNKEDVFTKSKVDDLK